LYSFGLDKSGDYTITCWSNTSDDILIGWNETPRSGLDSALLFGCFLVFLTGLFILVARKKPSLRGFITFVPSYAAKIPQDPNLQNYDHKDANP